LAQATPILAAEVCQRPRIQFDNNGFAPNSATYNLRIQISLHKPFYLVDKSQRCGFDPYASFNPTRQTGSSWQIGQFTKTKPRC
jgi:hypothetical protein